MIDNIMLDIGIDGKISMAILGEMSLLFADISIPVMNLNTVIGSELTFL